MSQDLHGNTEAIQPMAMPEKWQKPTLQGDFVCL